MNRKQYSILKDAINSLNEENTRQIETSIQLDKDIEEVENKRNELKNTKKNLIDKYNKCQEDIHELEMQCRELYKKKELEKDKIHSQKTERVRLDIAIRSKVKEVLFF